MNENAMPLPFQNPEGDWPEDAKSDSDNGAYLNRCIDCGGMFTGNKRRMSCRRCTQEHEAQWRALSLTEKKAAVRKLRVALGTIKL